MLKKERERNAHPPALRCYENRQNLAAQFAPQGNQTEQGKCRTCIGNSCRGNWKFGPKLDPQRDSPALFVSERRLVD